MGSLTLPAKEVKAEKSAARNRREPQKTHQIAPRKSVLSSGFLVFLLIKDLRTDSNEAQGQLIRV